MSTVYLKKMVTSHTKKIKCGNIYKNVVISYIKKTKMRKRLRNNHILLYFTMHISNSYLYSYGKVSFYLYFYSRKLKSSQITYNTVVPRCSIFNIPNLRWKVQ